MIVDGIGTLLETINMITGLEKDKCTTMMNEISANGETNNDISIVVTEMSRLKIVVNNIDKSQSVNVL